MPAVLNNIVGTRIRIVYGYPDGRDINLAMERGEVEGRATNPWASYMSTDPLYVEKKLIIPIIQMGMVKDPDLPAVPLMRDLAKNAAGREILDFMSRAVTVGRPIATTPGVPAERVAALRRAFDLTLKDPDFIKDARTQRAELQPMTGAELAQVVRDVIGAPSDLRDRVKAAIQPKNAKELPADKIGKPE
jgi:hypothetical protein